MQVQKKENTIWECCTKYIPACRSTVSKDRLFLQVNNARTTGCVVCTFMLILCVKDRLESWNYVHTKGRTGCTYCYTVLYVKTGCILAGTRTAPKMRKHPASLFCRSKPYFRLQYYTIKKVSDRHSRFQSGCHLPNSPWAGIISTLAQGEFAKWHPGWGQEENYSHTGGVW